MSEANPSPSPGATPPAPAAGNPPASGSQPSPAGGTSPTPAPPARPNYVPEIHWDATASAVKDTFGAHYNELAAFKAAEDSRRLTLPQNADAYKTELPADFKTPEGMKFEFKSDDPLLAQARTVAHELGISQEGFSKLLGLYAGSQVSSQQQIATARNAEVAKLGPTGPAQIDALSTFYKAHLGDTEGAQMMSRVLTASDVALHQKLIAKFTGNGGANFSTRGREPPGGKTEAEINAMTPAQRLDYTRERSQQTKMPDWRDPRAA